MKIKHTTKRKTPNNEKLKQDYESGLSIVEMGKNYKCSPQAVYYALKRIGIITRPIKQFGSIGEKHSQWKGGMIIKNGYPMKYSPNHKRRYNIPYVPMHVLVVEQRIGRTPLKTEPIHHINFDRADYSDKNLYLCKDNKEHAIIHSELEKLIGTLIKNGVIKFRNGKYYISVMDLIVK